MKRFIKDLARRGVSLTLVLSLLLPSLSALAAKPSEIDGANADKIEDIVFTGAWNEGSNTFEITQFSLKFKDGVAASAVAVTLVANFIIGDYQGDFGAAGVGDYENLKFGKVSGGGNFGEDLIFPMRAWYTTESNTAFGIDDLTLSGNVGNSLSLTTTAIDDIIANNANLTGQTITPDFSSSQAYQYMLVIDMNGIQTIPVLLTADGVSTEPAAAPIPAVLTATPAVVDVSGGASPTVTLTNAVPGSETATITALPEFTNLTVAGLSVGDTLAAGGAISFTVSSEGFSGIQTFEITYNDGVNTEAQTVTFTVTADDPDIPADSLLNAEKYPTRLNKSLKDSGKPVSIIATAYGGETLTWNKYQITSGFSFEDSKTENIDNFSDYDGTSGNVLEGAEEDGEPIPQRFENDLTITNIDTTIPRGSLLIFFTYDDGYSETPTPYVYELSLYYDYTVTYDANGGTLAASTADQVIETPEGSGYGTIGTDGTLPANPTRSGYEFLGWFDAAAGGTQYTDSTPITSDVTLYAQWKSTAATYTVTYDANAGTDTVTGDVPADETVTAGSTYTPKTASLTRTGYTFLGWNTNPNATTKLDNVTVDGDVTLYAVWKQVSEVTVTFHANGGYFNGDTTDTADQTVTADGSGMVTAPTVAKAADETNHQLFTFEGWYTDATNGTKVDFSAAISESQTVYAHWKTIQLHKVSFNGNENDAGTSAPADIWQTTGGGAVTLPGPGNLTKSGYYFIGWATSAGGEKVYDPAGTVPGTALETDDVTLYAVWAASWAINFIKNAPEGANAEDVQSMPDAIEGLDTTNATARISADAVPTLTNYKFKGWCEDANGTGTRYNPGANITITGNTDLYAVWEPLPHITNAALTNSITPGSTATLSTVTTSNASSPQNFDDLGGKVTIAQWWIGPGDGAVGSGATGPLYGSAVSGTGSTVKVPDETPASSYLWLKLAGDGITYQTTPCWVKFTLDPYRLTLSVTPIVFNAQGNETIATPGAVTCSPASSVTLSSGGVQTILTTNTGSDYEFIGWAAGTEPTSADCTTLTSGDSVGGGTLTFDTTAPTGTNLATFTAPASITSPSSVTIYAVYQAVPTYSFTLVLETGVKTVTVKKGDTTTTYDSNSTITGVKATDDITIIQTAWADGYVEDGFTYENNTDDNFKSITAVDAVLVCNIMGDNLTITANAKEKPADLQFTSTAGDGTYVAANEVTHHTDATLTISNAGGSATITGITLSCDGITTFADVTPNSTAITTDSSTNQTYQIEPTVWSNAEVNTDYNITVTIEYKNADGTTGSTKTSVLYRVSETTLFDGAVTVRKDGQAYTDATVTVTGTGAVNGNKDSDSNVTTFTGLTKSVSYTIQVDLDGNVYTVSERLSGNNPSVTVDFYTVTAKHANNADDNNALAPDASKVTLTISDGNKSETTEVTRDDLGQNAVGQDTIELVVLSGTYVTLTYTHENLATTYAFKNWSGSITRYVDGEAQTPVNTTTTDTSYRFMVDGPASYTASLQKIKMPRLTYLANYDYINEKLNGKDGSPMIAVPATQQAAAEGATLTVSSSVPQVPGYVFDHWNTQADGFGTTYEADTEITMYDDVDLYAIWKDTKLTAATSVAGSAGTYGAEYAYTGGYSTVYQVNGEEGAILATPALNYTLEENTYLPGGLQLDPDSGKISGRPYEVTDKKVATIVITLAEDYHKSGNPQAEVAYTMTVDKCSPEFVSLTINDAVAGTAINTATYTAKVTGPRFLGESNGPSPNDISDDSWEDSHIDIITFTSNDPGTAVHQQTPAETSGVGTIDSFVSGDATDATFALVGDTVVTATFTPRAWGYTTDVGTTSPSVCSAGAAFDGNNQKQNDVWSATTTDGAIIKSVTYTPDAVYELKVSAGDDTYADYQSWIYDENGNNEGGDNAHEGYEIDTTVTDGLVVLGEGVAADTVHAKQFVLKNMGNVNLTGLSASFGSGANSPFKLTADLSSGPLLPSAAATDNDAGKDTLEFSVQVDPDTAKTASIYRDRLTITSDQNALIYIDLVFTLESAKTYEAKVTTLFQTVENAYTSPSVDAAANKIGVPGGTDGIQVVLVPVGTALDAVDNGQVAIDSSVAAEKTNGKQWNTDGYYTVDLQRGDYYVYVRDTAGAYRLPDTQVTVSNPSVAVTLRQVALAKHKDDDSDQNMIFKDSDPAPTGEESGAGWYAEGHRYTVTAITAGTVAGDPDVAYTFQEWKEGTENCADSDHGANSSFTTTMGGAAVQYNAHYAVKQPDQVTLTYLANTSDPVIIPSADGPVEKNSSEKFTIASLKPIRDKYVFQYWVDENDMEENTDDETKAVNEYVVKTGVTPATFVPDGEGPAMDADHTLRAVWEPVAISPPGTENEWVIDPTNGTYGVDYNYRTPSPTINNGGKITYALKDGAALPGGLEVDPDSGAIVGKPYEVKTVEGLVIVATHTFADGTATTLESESFTLTVEPYQLILTNGSVTDVVIGSPTSTGTYTATVVDAPIYEKDEDTETYSWGIFHETVTLKSGEKDETSVGALSITSSTPETFNSTGTTVTLEYTPSDTAADGNGSKHSMIYSAGTIVVKTNGGVSSYTMVVSEDNLYQGDENKDASITMLGPHTDPATEGGAAIYQGGFAAKVGSEPYKVDTSGTDGSTTTTTDGTDTVNGQQFTLTNTGSQPTGELTYKFGSAAEANKDGSVFQFTPDTLTMTGDDAGLAAGASGTFIVTPVTGLAPKTDPYIDTLVITNSNGYQVSVTLKFTVTATDVDVSVYTYLWDVGVDPNTTDDDVINNAKRPMTAGKIELVSVDDGTIAATKSCTENETGTNQYKFTVDYDASYNVKVNGFYVMNTTTGQPAVLSRDNTATVAKENELTVYLYEVETKFHPNGDTDVAATAAPTMKNGNGSVSSTTGAEGSIYIVHGENVTITVNDVANAGYTYKELQNTTEDDAPDGALATGGKTFTVSVTSPMQFTAVYNKGVALTYQPNGSNDVVLTNESATQTAEALSDDGHAVGQAVTIKAPTDTFFQKTIDTTTYTGWTRAGYRFVGWSTQSGRSAKDWSPADHPTEDYAPSQSVVMDEDGVTLYAVWASEEDLTLPSGTIKAAYGENIGTKSFGATGGQGDYTYTVNDGSSDVATMQVAKNITFTNGGDDDAELKEKFTFSGTSVGIPGTVDGTVETTVAVTVTDGNNDTATADYVIVQTRANTAVTTPFTSPTDPVTAGETFDFTELGNYENVAVTVYKADGAENADINLVAVPDADGAATDTEFNKETPAENHPFNLGGTWTVTAIDGTSVTDGETVVYKPGEHVYTLTYTPDDPGFKPCTTTVTVTAEKTIDGVTVQITFPVNGEQPNTESTVKAVHGTANSPEPDTNAVTVTSVSWNTTTPLFDTQKNITVWVVVKPSGDWVFDNSKTDGGEWNFGRVADGEEVDNKGYFADNASAKDNVKYEVVSCTTTEAVLTYTWPAEDDPIANIRIQVPQPSAGSAPEKTAEVKGTPSYAFTVQDAQGNYQVKWVKADGGIEGINNSNYMSQDEFEGTCEANKKYVAIVTATVLGGFYFVNYDASKIPSGDGVTDEEQTTAKNAMLADINGQSAYAMINNTPAKVLNVTAEDGKATEVVLAIEVTVSASDVVGLTADPATLIYYVKTGSSEGHYNENATGHNANYDFTLDGEDVTIYTLDSDKNKVATEAYVLFVDGDSGTTTGQYDDGDVLLSTLDSATNTYSTSYTFTPDVAGTLGSSLDGKTVYAAYVINSGKDGVSIAMTASLTVPVGTLTVQPLTAQSIAGIAKGAGWTVDENEKFQITAEKTTTVDFNMGSTEVPVSYAARGGNYGLTAAAGATEMGTLYRPNYYYMLDCNADGKITADEVGTANVKDIELTDGMDVSAYGNKDVYICYTDVNGHLVQTKVGSLVESEFKAYIKNVSDPGDNTVDVTDEIGNTETSIKYYGAGEPEYGETIQVEVVGTPDGKLTYIWEAQYPEDTGTWKIVQSGPSDTYVPGKDAVGKTVRVTVMEEGTDYGGVVSVNTVQIFARTLSLDVVTVNKTYDGTATNSYTYNPADFILNNVLPGDAVSVEYSGSVPNYSGSEVGATITWPAITADTETENGTIHDYSLTCPMNELKAADEANSTEAVSVPVYRLGTQEALSPRGKILPYNLIAPIIVDNPTVQPTADKKPGGAAAGGGTGSFTTPDGEDRYDVDTDDPDGVWMWKNASDEWVTPTTNNGLDADGKFIPGETYQVTIKVVIADESEYTFDPGAKGFIDIGDGTTVPKGTMIPAEVSLSDDKKTATLTAEFTVGGDDVKHVDVWFDGIPLVNNKVSDLSAPQRVTDLDETQSGETGGGTDFKAHWYNTTGVTAPALGDLTTDKEVTDDAAFEAGQYTVKVLVKPVTGCQFSGDGQTGTHFNFHFGATTSVQVVMSGATLDAGQAVGLAEDDGVWAMWYTFTVTNKTVEKITAVTGTFWNSYYAATAGHTENTTGTNNAPGSKALANAGTSGPKFAFDYTITSVTVTYADNTTEILNDASTGDAKALFDSAKANVAGVSLDQGYGFTQNTNDAGRFDGQAVKVAIGDVVSDDNAVLTDAGGSSADNTLIVKELAASSITATGTLTTTQYDLRDAAPKFSSDGITGVSVKFLDGVANLEKTETTGGTISITEDTTNNSAHAVTEYYYELDNGTELLSGVTEITAGMDGRAIYACYTDVNGHEVRTQVGTISIISGSASTAAVYLKNLTHSEGNTVYGDKLEAVVVGAAAGDTVTCTWQRLKVNGDGTLADAEDETNWEDITKDGVAVTGTSYTASKDDVGTQVRVKITAHTDQGGNPYQVSAAAVTSALKVGKKPITLTWTMTPATKTYDATTALPALAGITSSFGTGDLVKDYFAESADEADISDLTTADAKYDTADVGAGKTIVFDSGKGVLNENAAFTTPTNATKKWSDLYTTTIVPATGDITAVQLAWDDFAFSVGKVKRYDGATTVYAADNETQSDNTGPLTGPQPIGANFQWADNCALGDAAKTELAKTLRAAFAFTSEHALGENNSSIEVDLTQSADNANYVLPSGTWYIPSCTVNAKQITVTNADLSGYPNFATVVGVPIKNLPGKVEDFRPAESYSTSTNRLEIEADKTLTFSIAAGFAPVNEPSENAAVTFDAASLNWTDTDYELVWGGASATGKVNPNAVHHIISFGDANGVYGEPYSSIADFNVVVAFDEDGNSTMTLHTLKDMTDLGLTVKVNTNDTASVIAETDPIPWDNKTANSATLNYYVFKDNTQLTVAGSEGAVTDQGGTISVSQRIVRVDTAVWNMQDPTGTYKSGKYYDGTTNAITTGNLWPAGTNNKTETGSVTVTPKSGDVLSGDAVTLGVASAVLDDPNAGEHHTITVTPKLEGTNSNRYKAESPYTLTDQKIVPRPITVTFDPPTVPVGYQNPADGNKPTVGLNKTFQTGDTLVAGEIMQNDSVTVSTTGTFANVSAAANNVTVTVVKEAPPLIWDNQNYAVTVQDTTGVVVDTTAADPNPPDSTVIDRVAANVQYPVDGETRSTAAAKLLALFDDNQDAMADVTLSAIVWTESGAFGSGYIAPADNSFHAGKYYQAVFTAEAINGKTFENKDTDSDGTADDFVAFLVNSVTHTEGQWVNDKKTPDSATLYGIQVMTKQDGSSDKYTITVWFPLTSATASVLTIWGNAEQPAPFTPAGGETLLGKYPITVAGSEPYEIVADNTMGDGIPGAQWYTTADCTAAATEFKAGETYYAALTVAVKADQKGKYQFTTSTNGYINDTADGATTVTYYGSGKNEITTGTPEYVKLLRPFTVPKAMVPVHVGSAVPTKAVTGDAVSEGVAIHADYIAVDQDYYSLDDGTLSGSTTPVQGQWYAKDGGNYVLVAADYFAEGANYYLITTVKAKDGYYLSDSLTDYWWVDNNKTKSSVTAIEFVDDAANRTVDANGNTTARRVAFLYHIDAVGDRHISIIPGWADQPVYGGSLSNIRTNNTDFDIYQDIQPYWTIGATDGATAEIGSAVAETTTYFAHINVVPKTGVIIEDGTYQFNDLGLPNAQFVTHEAVKDDSGSLLYYSLVYEFEPTGKKPDPEVIYTGGSGGGSGGGTTTVEVPVVTYALRDNGVTNDLTAEKVEKNSYPQNVPEVTAIKGLHFAGWSETDPSELSDGTLPTLVDPKTVKITKDKTFYAVYEKVESEYDHTHYVIGFPDGTFAPDAKITRAEVATIIARSCLDGFVEGGSYGNPGNYFDVSEHWAFSAISYCSKNGVFSGYEDGTFRPDRYITRQELATVVARLAGVQQNQGLPFDDSSAVANWALNGVYTAYVNGWINGYEDNTFLPERDISRAETVKIFNGYLVRGVDKDGLSDMKEYVHTGVASNNTENGHDEYMTWPDVAKTHWAYYEIIEAANDHNYHWTDTTQEVPPETWEEVYINERWRYNDNPDDGAANRDENMNAQTTFTVTYLVSSNGQTYDSITETVDRFASPKPENLPVAVPNPGYRFAGWSSTDPSTGSVNLVDPTAISVTEDKWYYAVFEADKPYELPKYTVTYIIGEHGSYDGATVEQVEMYQSPSVSGLPKITAEEGWRFAGWSETDPATGTVSLIDPTEHYVTGDKTFYAVYAAQ